jgi:DNA-binding PadR family transcriptional regulator
VNELVQKLQNATTSEPVAEVSEKGKQLVEKAFENPAVTEAHAKVVKGLSSLNEELRKMASSLADDKHTNNDTPPKSE